MNQILPLSDAEIISRHVERVKRAQRELDAAKMSLIVARYGGVRRIIAVVANAYDITFEDIVSQKMTRGGDKRITADMITPRQVAMYISKTMTKLQMSQLGRILKRDRTTILSGYKKIDRMMEHDPALKAKVESIMESIREAAARPVADLAA